ncbi:MAG: dTDP-4-dehydro-6-deoxyglucose aminotransferase [Holophagaceae bacterium]|nr:dTDP-4-dehydro-6-deoxyglucose aminotransferase [Holophagaceae bacterium]
MRKVWTTPASLACFGAPPAFPAPLCVGRPQNGNLDDFYERLRVMFEQNWLTNQGPMVQELETVIAERLGVRHVVAFCNGTVALEMMLRALEVVGEVIVPSFTFIATVHAIRTVGLKPVFVDVGANHTLDPEAVERAITPDTVAILGVHLWGQGCDLLRLREIADRHRLKLLFDAAHAFGCSTLGKPLGGSGDCEVFSLHATKVFHSFEGGLATTDDDLLAERLRLMRNFGFSGYDHVVSAGGNGKMSEPAAAMALTNLKSLPAFIEVNRTLYEAYRKALRGIPGLALLEYNTGDVNNYQYVVLEIDADRFGLSRDQLQGVLSAENVLARRYFHPGSHRMEPYSALDPGASDRLPRTESLCERVLVLPTGAQMSEADAGLIASLIHFCQGESVAIRARWGGTPEDRRPSASDTRTLTPCDSPRILEISHPTCMEQVPLVSVTMSTYNHEPWIAKSIEGILAQRCNFPFEIIIGEDGSSDSTLAICQEYQRRNPAIIRLVSAEKNTGSKANLRRIFQRIRGRYQALCEGDDWWCDPDKLQHQVDFLEAHPECSLCFTKTRRVRGTSDALVEDGLVGPPDRRQILEPEAFMGRYLAHTSSLLLRTLSAYPDWFWDPRCLGDIAIHFLCMEKGPAGFLDRIASVYRVTGQGIWTGKSQVEQALAMRDTFRLLRQHGRLKSLPWQGFLERRCLLEEVKLGRAMQKAGLRREAGQQWRHIYASGDLRRHPGLWWKAFKLAARNR